MNGKTWLFGKSLPSQLKTHYTHTMVKVLLISDTHGHLDLINERAHDTKADMVIHAGDFGFYDKDSANRLSARELSLLIRHSALRDRYPVSAQTGHAQLASIVTEHNLLGSFPEYLSGQKKFDLPVYAIWGNHEDVHTLREMRAGLTVPNLHILDENHPFEFEDFSLAGIGGNFLVKRLFDKPIAGESGKVFGTLHQFGVLLKKILCKEKPSIFVSHVSPGKEPLLACLLAHLAPNFSISGHMGPPYPCVWNQFTIRETDESLQWFQSKLALLEEQATHSHVTDEARFALKFLTKPPENTRWLRNLWNINLPDAKDGHAVLTIDNAQFALETHSKPVHILCHTV